MGSLYLFTLHLKDTHDAVRLSGDAGTVTPSRKRVETMVEAVRGLAGGKESGLFLFVDRDTLGASNPLDVEWVSGKGELKRLMQ